MTIQEMYEKVGGSYASVKKILPMDKMIAKFAQRFLTDKSFESCPPRTTPGTRPGCLRAPTP